MGFFKSEKGSIISDIFSLEEDLAQFAKGDPVEVALYDDHLELTDKTAFKKLSPISLKYAQITDVYYGLQTEIKEENKSTIGRAAAGGLLFGPAGAVVGAVSGSGKKEKKVSKFMFIISYTSSSGEDKFLQFQDTRMYKGVKLSKKLKELCGVSDVKEEITEL